MRALGIRRSLSGGAAANKTLSLRAMQKGTLTSGKAYTMEQYGVAAAPMRVSISRLMGSEATGAVVGKHHRMRIPEAAPALVGKECI